MKTSELIDRALEQIRADVECGDLTAIEELLKKIPEDVLIAFIPEELKEGAE